MSKEFTQQYQLFAQSLKKVFIVIVDEHESIKSGDCQGFMMILRKLLFSTSSVIINVLQTRSCTIALNDLKTVIAFFEFLRDIVKKPAGISIDQWFSQVISTSWF